jgi:hypothetical protein
MIMLRVSPPFNTPVFGREVLINLPGTKLATNQVEYMVFLNELNKRLAVHNIFQDELFLQNPQPFVLDSQPFLSRDEKLLSSMYVGIRWTRRAPIVVAPPVIEPPPLLPRLEPGTNEAVLTRGEHTLRFGVSGDAFQSGIASILQGIAAAYPQRREGLDYFANPGGTIGQLQVASKAKTIDEFAKWIRVPIIVIGSGNERPSSTPGDVILTLLVVGGYEPLAVVRNGKWVFALPPNDPYLR